MAETIFNRKIILNGDMSGNLTSPWVDLSKINNYSITADWTGSPVGEFKIEFGNDEALPRTIPQSVIAVNGPNDASFIEATPAYDKVRVVYTATSGSGSLTVQINGKGNED